MRSSVDLPEPDGPTITVTLPRGVVDLAADIPPHDIGLLATTTSLLTREQTHPALRQLFAQAAQGD